MYDVYKIKIIAEGLCVETQAVEKVKPDSLNLSVKTVVGSGIDINNDKPGLCDWAFTLLEYS